MQSWGWDVRLVCWLILRFLTLSKNLLENILSGLIISFLMMASLKIQLWHPQLSTDVCWPSDLRSLPLLLWSLGMAPVLPRVCTFDSGLMGIVSTESSWEVLFSFFFIGELVTIESQGYSSLIARFASGFPSGGVRNAASFVLFFEFLFGILLGRAWDGGSSSEYWL